MFELTEQIEYLVFQHDCVVIPGVGAIIAYHKAAYVNKENNSVFPPVRELTFNPQIIHTDGLLAASVARKEKVTFEKASSMVAQSIADMMTCLDSQNEVSLGRVGTLRKNSEGSIEYSPLNQTLFGFFDAYQPVDLRQRESEIVDQQSTKTERIYPIVKKFANIAASVVVLLMLGLMLTTPIVDNEAIMASMSGLRINKTENIHPVLFDNGIELNIALPDPKSAIGEIQENNIIDVPDNSNSYYLIVASLPTKEKAREFINDHSGTNENFRILNCDQRYRVYIEKTSTINEALLLRSSNGRIDNFPGMWVFNN
ncbi:MAG: hypothetical protein NC343_04795 [Muribaculum sp.]|nr:hypothetical protein [Muribaculaceae bacterium]MCM1081050.1 hypothetical protein [Muribaculum sp.]